MDPAARKWLKEYKKLFNQVANHNAGASVAENLNSKFGIRNSELDGSNTEKKIVKLGKITDASTGTAITKVIGKVVDDNALEPNNNTFGSNTNAEAPSDNGLRTKNGNKKTLTSTNDKNMQVSGRSALAAESKVRITANMTDSERAEILRNRTLNVPIYKGQADSVIEDVKQNYESKKKEFGKKAVVEIAEKLGIIHESINFKDVDVSIELSNRNLKESITKEATPEQVAKLLPILSETAKSAVAIERHDNRYYHDSDTVYFDNLVGAYIDDGNVVPVRFGLKYSRTGKTTLYVVVDQNNIPIEKLTEIKKTEVIATNGPDKSATEDHLNSVTYSISQILSFVNSKDLLRYIPDDFISFEQMRAKRAAIAETQEYTNKKNDKKYSDFVKQGNLRAAKDMLSAKSKAEGYTRDLSYQGSLAFNGAAPSSNAYFLTKEERIEAFERGDFEGDYSFGDFVDNGLDNNDPEWQLNNPIAASGRDRATLASIRNLSSVIRQGKRTIRMYRAVDSKIKENSFRNGDWVTPSREYAEKHIDLQSWESGRIIEQEVSIDDIWWNGDDINEWGYDNGDTSELYSNTPNNVKTSEITYDDEGRLIPISKGYDENNPDSRYALADGKKVTSTDVARVKGLISEAGIDPRGILGVSDHFFGRYDGTLTRTGLRFEFLEAAQLMLDDSESSFERAYNRIEAIADELVYNEKASGGFADDLKEIQRHIQEITFEIRDQDKGEFDSLGGFNEFRKKHFGKLKIGNDGASVDSIYGELQTLYGLSLFPDQNTVQEQLIRIAEVVDMDLKMQRESGFDIESARDSMAVDITHRLVEAFDNKLPQKAERMSKTDAEAYKARINARAEAKAAKAIATAKKRLERIETKLRAQAEKKITDAGKKLNETLETERTKLTAEYETDRVFTQSSVKNNLGTIEAFKALPASARSEISRRVWKDFSESNGYDSREWLVVKHSAELTEQLVRERADGADRSKNGRSPIAR